MTGRADDGFTLIELLVAMAILGVIVGAVASAVIVGLRTTGDTQARLGESHDAQMASAYFVTDANSARNVAYGAATTCDGDDVDPSALPISFSWVDGTVTKVADYVVETVGAERRLSRLYCESGGFPKRITVVHRLQHTGTPWSVTCLPECSPTPSLVRLTLTDVSGYTYTLSAVRRTSP